MICLWDIKLIKALNDIPIKPSEKIRSDIFGIEGIASHEYWLAYQCCQPLFDL